MSRFRRGETWQSVTVSVSFANFFLGVGTKGARALEAEPFAPSANCPLVLLRKTKGNGNYRSFTVTVTSPSPLHVLGVVLDDKSSTVSDDLQAKLSKASPNTVGITVGVARGTSPTVLGECNVTPFTKGAGQLPEGSVARRGRWLCHQGYATKICKQNNAS